MYLDKIEKIDTINNIIKSIVLENNNFIQRCMYENSNSLLSLNIWSIRSHFVGLALFLDPNNCNY